MIRLYFQERRPRNGSDDALDRYESEVQDELQLTGIIDDSTGARRPCCEASQGEETGVRVWKVRLDFED
jgi:hypothetical protein